MPPKSKEPKPEAAEAAATESETKPEPIKVEWRGITFTIDRSVLASARLRLVNASGDAAAITFELLGPEQAGVFLTRVQRGESGDDVFGEFIGNVNKAGGWGNSNASG